ncbi:hypothetical protein A3B21_00555 [Candidatus Uhrbacteria bacterium RIFCSPLOWO2_01_FULL_47_24]|uniref:PEP-utilising enzyme mobile domain-containing protein n=1 Tax=Candidatus Uhrbacteria bacterium RIFCSPLOWO2_01_FULL_47_24 TaxID=1802401 RepID=A0A1F7UNN8_9BACT|nr:MAG: hypothetical protein A2753_04725 [Candidatus Uhrbacteria bacterium RIFCSPHIGHO2_01_FULL_47_11]OGL67664.1 MAG: hypothetical protein A3D58_04445 [Candidatus Uhrbacteria bacterium RIFCSPHIGHO2_02_FULL_46_47]OGL74847.1 MAG: hypothetical protein A3F52_00210 [Candidatus Uhrbacteria bacterium RIFCSPHIGHO2_12_FULL_47_11]OGL79869.1 MAG: hypothetical protein A3B21_00555 [Candidatus Uhrbacteria bacterium RIFCSPLOWO2_01_FULL_47_24]OGL84089.1 MAG: hypothetical protein A3J03_03350 [Candidatus Uhrbact
MRWFFSVKRPLYILDASLLCDGDLHELGEVLGVPYSRTFLLMEDGEASFYVLTSEVKRQTKVLVSNRTAAACILAELPRYQRNVRRALKDLTRATKKNMSLVVPFENFARAYRLFTTYRVITRIIGYEHELPRAFLWKVGKLRLDFKNSWTEIRSELEKVWETLARKYHVPKEAIKSLTAQEFLEGLRTKNFQKAVKLHKERQKRTVVYRDARGERILTDKKADQFIQKELGRLRVREVRELRGTIACRGTARGSVKIISNPKGVRVRERFILVTSMTTPEFVPLLKYADAIVTDEGGLTSHAAIISREMKIPCVIGTRFATRVLKNGDRVEVDAERGVVKKL